MTRAEKLARQERHTQAQLLRARQHYAEVKKRRKQAEQQARERRYVLVGAMADEAGLLALSDSTLAALFALVAQLKDVPNPVPILEALLHDVCGGVGAGVPAAFPSCRDAGVDVRGTAAPTCGGVTALQ